MWVAAGWLLVALIHTPPALAAFNAEARQPRLMDVIAAIAPVFAALDAWA